MKYQDRAQCVIDEVNALPTERASLTDDGKMKSLVNGVLAGAKYDWAAVDATLFPKGTGVLDVDLKDPTIAAAWKAIRQDQRAIVENAVRTQWKATPARGEVYTHDEHGFRFQIDLGQLLASDPAVYVVKHAYKIAQKHFPEFFWKDGDLIRLQNHWDAVPDPTTEVGYVRIELRNAMFNHGPSGFMSSRYAKDDQSFVADLLAAMAAILTVDTVETIKYAKENFRARQRVDEETRRRLHAKPKGSLTDYLQRRIDQLAV